MKACRRCLVAGFFVEPEAVFAHGKSAEVLLIGQAPGVTEVEAQRPFNAGSGTACSNGWGKLVGTKMSSGRGIT